MCVHKQNISGWGLSCEFTACDLKSFQLNVNEKNVKMKPKVTFCAQDSSDVSRAERTHRVRVRSAQSWSQRGVSGLLGEDSTAPRGETLMRSTLF